MADDQRFEQVVACSQRMFERFGVHPRAITPRRLARVIYAVLDAVHASEKRLQHPAAYRSA